MYSEALAILDRNTVEFMLDDMKKEADDLRVDLNKMEGNRKFIIIEMEDYADNVTAERVKRVINGYTRKKDGEEVL